MANKKQPLLKAVEHNWGLTGPGDWSEVRWLVLYDGSYEHCENVAELSRRIDWKLSLKSDLNVLLVGAMLHDFYLYDWHSRDSGAHRLHGFRHAKRARENARKYFDIDERTGRVIARHMWPLNPFRLPRSREEWIVCVADKCVSLRETLFRR